MIPDEIIRRRFPPAYGYKIPRFHYVDKFDPLLSGVNDPASENKDDVAVREEPDSPETVPSETAGFGTDENPVSGAEAHRLLPSNYSLRIAYDQATIASDIRKYLSSHHLNPIRSSHSIRYDRSLRRFHF